VIRPATRERIEAALRFSAFYRDYLANHLPMALVALDAMGADDGAIARFAERYESHLEPLPPATFAIAAGEEARHLGARDAFPAWVGYFDARIAREGRVAVLREWTGRLAPGVGTAAFHGAIRTAYGLESGSDRELAHGLAYWAAAFEPLGAPPACDGSRSAGQVLALLASDPAHAGRRLPGKSIAERMRHAVALPGFPVLAASVDRDKLSLDDLAAALLRCYAASGDFTILHGITGCHAFRLLARYAPEADVALAHLWVAVLAAYLGTGSPAVEGWNVRGSDALGWSAILERAARCDDEHDVKLAYSCWREWQRTADETYRRAASARVCHAQREAMAC
jgi:hypothetical protein